MTQLRVEQDSSILKIYHIPHKRRRRLVLTLRQLVLDRKYLDKSNGKLIEICRVYRKVCKLTLYFAQSSENDTYFVHHVLIIDNTTQRRKPSSVLTTWQRARHQAQLQRVFNGLTVQHGNILVHSIRFFDRNCKV